MWCPTKRTTALTTATSSLTGVVARRRAGPEPASDSHRIGPDGVRAASIPRARRDRVDESSCGAPRRLGDCCGGQSPIRIISTPISAAVSLEDHAMTENGWRRPGRRHSSRCCCRQRSPIGRRTRTGDPRVEDMDAQSVRRHLVTVCIRTDCGEPMCLPNQSRLH